jgi:hypothetical protein
MQNITASVVASLLIKVNVIKSSPKPAASESDN